MPEISSLPDREEDDDEEIEDETIWERIYALNEMFPAPVCKAASSTAKFTVKYVKKGYGFSRTTLWYASACFVVLVLPVVFEQERFSLEQQQLAQQRQMLLGPNAVVSGMGGPGGMPGMGMAPAPERK